MLISKLYRQIDATTGIATDSARVQRLARWARRITYACRPLFFENQCRRFPVMNPVMSQASIRPWGYAAVR
jgi:hypothetical protein